eukprot:TRINITY_DN6914_c0_g1_i5.p2 TRINITY_DN6914_c0_g1~~TRINITY_DN6914_c0_g1_i5.p2  ORF type:complete len:128 (+),score=20.28 TRINITY_DN6914_c0_g1_i5:117-500(+)
MINTSKNFNTYESEGICVKEYAYYEDINATYKPAMEDGYILEDDILGDDVHGLFGILDGHGGRQVVEHCVSAIPTAGFLEYPQEELEDDSGGALEGGLHEGGRSITAGWCHGDRVYSLRSVCCSRRR